jgi:hypothetical protein
MESLRRVVVFLVVRGGAGGYVGGRGSRQARCCVVVAMSRTSHDYTVEYTRQGGLEYRRRFQAARLQQGTQLEAGA